MWSNFLTQRRKGFAKGTKIFSILFLSLTIIISAYYFSQYARDLLNTKELLNHPRPLPDYLIGIAPYPGTKYPTDELSYPYWAGGNEWMAGTVNGDVICVGFDARTIDPNVTRYSDNDMVPTDKLQLLLNKMPVNSQNRMFIYSSFLVDFPDPDNREIDDSVALFNLCWKIALAPGIYFAQINIHSYNSGLLQYQWAFTVTRP